uniref:SFRICE_006279 n=1 Tax=Spodoptera frugiperda TaxID=7108 RepID=A0A2H1VFB9_SPOFR
MIIEISTNPKISERIPSAEPQCTATYKNRLGLGRAYVGTNVPRTTRISSLIQDQDLFRVSRNNAVSGNKTLKAVL